MKARARNQAGKALTAEFAVALTVFLLITMFPLINLIGFAMGAGTQYLMTVQCAGGAGASTSFNDALSAMDREAISFANSGFGKFANLQPVGGHNGTGADLYLIETSLAGNNVLSYGPNTGGPAALNSNANVYEYQVRSTFDVGPFLSMSQMPWIGNIPGVGRPARLSFVAHRTTEFTEGLAMGATGSPVVASSGGGGSTGGAGGAGGGGGAGGVGSGGAGPTILATGPSTGGSITNLASSSSNSGSSAGSSSGGGGNDRRRRRRNNNNNNNNNSSSGASIAASSSSSTQAQAQNNTTNAAQSQSGTYSTTISGLGTNSGSVSQTAQNNSNNGGGSSQATTSVGTSTVIPNTNLTVNTSNNASLGSNTSSYNYTNNTGPNTVGGLVVTTNQSGSGTQSQSSSIPTQTSSQNQTSSSQNQTQSQSSPPPP